MRRRPVEDDQHINRWVISWADFLTLLFAFFVVMYGISSVNQEKYRELAESMQDVFERVGGTGAVGQKDTLVNDAGPGILDGGQTLSPEPSVFIDRPAAEAVERLRALQARFSSELTDVFPEGDVEIDGNELWLSIEIRSALLFEAADVLPAIEADPLLSRIALILAEGDNPIHVEGHTDDQPISNPAIESNWELSAMRAASVVRTLQLDGIAPERMAAVGYGQYKPAYSNRSAEGQRLNRRIVIVVSRDEAVRGALLGTGSAAVSEQTVRSLLAGPEPEAQGALEQVETPQGVLFRQADTEQTQEQ